MYSNLYLYHENEVNRFETEQSFVKLKVRSIKRGNREDIQRLSHL